MRKSRFDATFYTWRSRYGGREVSDVKRLEALEEENRKLKKLQRWSSCQRSSGRVCSATARTQLDRGSHHRDRVSVWRGTVGALRRNRRTPGVPPRTIGTIMRRRDCGPSFFSRLKQVRRDRIVIANAGVPGAVIRSWRVPDCSWRRWCFLASRHRLTCFTDRFTP
jgi:hypothetical protein